MKIDRLIGIITILLQNEKVTAPYLAEKFEVSRRTINRDIEDICKAGIPVVTLQGSKGGISIADGYKIDKTVFTDAELRAVFSGLLGLDSIAEDKKYRNIIDKFFPEKSGIYTGGHIMVNLSSHYKESLAPKIAEIQQAVESARKIEFAYYSRSGEQKVTLDPYLLVFQWSSWYVFGYNYSKAEFRLYKLNRLWQLCVTEQAFQVQEVPKEKLDFDGYFTDEIHAVILFGESVKHRLIEEYGIENCRNISDGKVRFEFAFTNEDYLIEWVLSFGSQAQLLEPVNLRAEIKARLEKALQNYSKT